jgi:hypothetical protein
MFGKLRGNALSWAICIVTAMAQLLFGYDLGVMGGLVSHPSFEEAFGVSHRLDTANAQNPSTSMIGTIVAIYNIGSMVGCIVIAIIGDKLARRGSIFAGCIIVIIGATLQATSFSVAQLIVARIVTVSSSITSLTLGVWHWIHLLDRSYICLGNFESPIQGHSHCRPNCMHVGNPSFTALLSKVRCRHRLLDGLCVYQNPQRPSCLALPCRLPNLLRPRLQFPHLLPPRISTMVIRPRSP